jgi:flavin reductase (DIM6/NTAB) family NADH-FMN oxidoreductase RutF
VAKKSLPLSKVYQLIEPGPVVMVATAYKGKTNIMTMTWHMMVEFVPPLIACVISDENYSFSLLTKSKECVINIPTVELAKKVVGVGNTTGAKIDKFKKFNLSPEPASRVSVPLISECYANLECDVVDTKMVKKYNIFILEVVKAWVRPYKKRPRMIHHCGYGVFVVDGNIIKLPSKKM